MAGGKGGGGRGEQTRLGEREAVLLRDGLDEVERFEILGLPVAVSVCVIRYKVRSGETGEN